MGGSNYPWIKMTLASIYVLEIRHSRKIAGHLRFANPRARSSDGPVGVPPESVVTQSLSPDAHNIVVVLEIFKTVS